MATLLYNYPLIELSDGIISFLQYIFSKPNVTPAEFRWNSDERATKVFISGPFSISRQKVGQLPTITVARGPFTYENRVIDNHVASNPNVMTDPQYLDILTGPISLICEAGTGPEATGLASFCALELQAHRKDLALKMEFVHRITWVGISPETPVKEEAEIVRWQCSVTFNASVYTGWVRREIGGTRFNKAAIYDGYNGWESAYGTITQGSDLLVDNSADFGFLTSNNPQLLQSEYDDKWYFVNLENGNKKYTVEELVNSKTLRLSQTDENGNQIPFNPSESKTVSYKLMWNRIHVYSELPKRS